MLDNGASARLIASRKRLIGKLMMEQADAVSRHKHIDRREFLASACGVATTLYVSNLVGGCGRSKMAAGMVGPVGAGAGGASGVGGWSGDAGFGGVGGSGSGGLDAMLAPGKAPSCAEGNELIIDLQTHFGTPEVDPIGALALDAFIRAPDASRFPWIVRSPGVAGAGKYDRTEYIAQILMGSDTTIGVLSNLPYELGADGVGVRGFPALTNEDVRGGADYFESQFPGRILTQCAVMPNDRLDLQLAMMERNAATFDLWNTHTAWSPNGDGGYWLNGPEGHAMLQKGIDLGAPVFCIHKCLPRPDSNATYTNPKDVGPAARAFPDAHLVIYASAFELGFPDGQRSSSFGPVLGSHPEGPYPGDNPSDPTLATAFPRDRSVNALITSLRDAGIGPNGINLPGFEGMPETHVYVDCATVWANLMTRPIEAQHYWGKLLKHIGEDRILWGTDCLWFGSPQPLIEGFRTFTISDELQNKYGYPALTQARKEKILGRNAARLQAVRGKQISGCHDDHVSV